MRHKRKMDRIIDQAGREKYARRDAERSVEKDHTDKRIQKLVDDYSEKIDAWIPNATKFDLKISEWWKDNRDDMKLAFERLKKKYQGDQYILGADICPEGWFGSYVRFYLIQL